jgi:hypothetical protein
MLAMLWNIALATAQGVVALVMGYLGFLLTLHPIDSGDAKRIRRYKATFGILSVLTVALIVWQGIRTEVEKKDAETATSNMIKAERAEHQRETAALGKLVVDRDDSLTNISREQLEVSRRELALKYKVSANFFHNGGRFELHNRGQTDITYWGNKWGDLAADIFKEPRLIPPGQLYFFPTDDEWEKMRLSKMGTNAELTEPLQVYLKDALQREWVMEGLIISISKDSKLTTNVQIKSVTMRRWPTQE